MLDHPEFARLAREHAWDAAGVLTMHDGVWCAATPAAPDSTFSDATQLMIADAAETGLWYRERTCLIQKAMDRHAIRGPVWDLGAGTGVVTPHLVRSGESAIAVEPSAIGAQIASGRGVTAIAATLEALRLPDDAIRSVAMLDVLEHLGDPQATLQEAVRVLEPGGGVIVTVPAFGLLWSRDDIDAGHHRRYRRGSLVQLLEDAGLTVLECRYFFAVTAIAVLIARALPHRLGLWRPLISTSDAVAAGGGRLGDVVAAVERRLVGRVPFGSSLIAVARKPG